jgi:uncharacterized membrane protein YjfL (UPF0719 family)
MENNLLNLALLQFGVSMLLSITAIYITLKIINKLILKKYSISKDNLAYAILAGGIIFSVAYLISGVTIPILNTIRFLKEASLDSNIYVEVFKYIGIFLSIGLVTACLINVLSIFLFTYLTKGINEFDEIKENNKAVALITAVIIISISFIMKDSMIFLIETFIPYPSIPNLI